MDALEAAKRNAVEIADLRFTDIKGLWQHISVSFECLTEELFEAGKGFDGSSIRGFQEINESDMLAVPDRAAYFIDTFSKNSTINIISDIRDPVSGEHYTKDPRHVARKAEDYLRSSGIAETSSFGPELEFYILDCLRFGSGPNFSGYFFDSEEGAWNTGKNSDRRPNLGHRPRLKEAYFPVPPIDSLHDIRSEMMVELGKAGVPAEVHHHEVGSGGQTEIGIRHGPLLATADNVMKYKYITKNVAKRNDKTVTFMPKINPLDNGSGMHTHISLWKDGDNIFYKKGKYADLSDIGVHFIGGLLHHAYSLLAFCAPTTNSYRRLVPGFEAPVNLAYSKRNRSACIRIPMYSSDPGSKRIEFRPPDPACNPYLAFSAMLMAGLDGIRKETAPPEHADFDLYHAGGKEGMKIRSTPGSLEESLHSLENDRGYLLEGGVFTQDLIESYIEIKRSEMSEMISRPHQYEFHLYSHL